MHAFVAERGTLKLSVYFSAQLAKERPGQADYSGFVAWRDTRLMEFWAATCAEIAASALTHTPLMVGRDWRG